MMVMVSGIATDTPGSADPSSRPPNADVDTDAANDGAKRWPASMAWVAAWCCPRTLATRTNHITLTRALLFQLSAGVVVALTMLLLFGLADTDSFGLRDISHALQNQLLGLWLEVGGNWFMFLLAISAVTLLIEVYVLVLAALLMPWGARDELLRDSYRSSLRRTMLQLAQVLPLVLVVGTSAVSLDRMKSSWERAYASPQPVAPKASATTDPKSPERKAYDLAYVEYTRDNMEWHGDRWRAMPWHLKYNAVPIAILVACSVCWLVSGLLRGVGAPRPVTLVTRPPTCEACGYNLTATPMEGRCSECGEPVENSLGPHVRPGTAWQRRATSDWLSAGARTARELMTDPKGFGRSIVVSDPGTDHRRFFALHLPVVFLIAPVGMLASVSIVDVQPPPLWAVPLFLVMFGTVAIVCAIGVSLSGALVYGLGNLRRDGSNLMSVTMQIACYLAPVVVGCEIVGALSMVLVFFSDKTQYLDKLVEGTRISKGACGMLIWGTPVAIATLYYLSLLFRATAGARYANR